MKLNIFKKKKKTNVEIRPTSFVDKNSSVGEYTYIGEYCKISKSKIGRYCSIGDNVTIGAGEHDISAISTSAYFYEGNWYDKLTQKDCEIGNDVWIGVNAVIRRGVKVGNGAVIGANSFVNKDVPEFAVVVGSPCRIIKYRFCEDKIEKIKNSKYWEKDLDEAKSIVKKLEMIENANS